ncbi:MAG: molybdate ABC transporter permease subunit [Myxococcales bacterium]|nr:molybdate ABC transporter permease subunit [Myxococcales bacterium]
MRELFFPILLSAQVAVLALAIVAPLGVLVAWLQASRAHPLRRLVDVLVLLPMLLPPTVLGFFLVLACGRRGPVGRVLEEVFGVRLIFTPAAAVVASGIVAFPVLVKAAQPAMEAVPRELIDVGRSLGLGPVAVFFRVVLRWCWRSVATGLLLAFVRALGEFGATMMFAGMIPGVTNTMPLEIFALYQRAEDDRALVYVGVLVLVSIMTAWLASRAGELRGGPR